MFQTESIKKTDILGHHFKQDHPKNSTLTSFLTFS